MSDDLLASIGTRVCSTVIYYVQGPEAFDKYMVGQKNVGMVTHAREDTAIQPNYRKRAPEDTTMTGDDERISEKHETELAHITENEARVKFSLRQAQGVRSKYNTRITCILREIQSRREMRHSYHMKMIEMDENNWETTPINDKRTATKEQLQRLCASYIADIENLKKELSKAVRRKNNAEKVVQQHEALLERMDTLMEAIETNISNKRFVETVKAIDTVQKSISPSMKAKDVEKLMTAQTKAYDDVNEISEILSAPIQMGIGLSEDYTVFDDDDLDKMMADYSIADMDYDQPGSSSSNSKQMKKKEPTPYIQLVDSFATDTEYTDTSRVQRELPSPYTPPVSRPARFSKAESSLLATLFD